MSNRKKHKALLLVCGVLWLLTVGAGLKALSDYARSGGEPADPPEHWPARVRITPDPERATLVMLVHPHCPCSRASIGELARLMTTCREKLTAYVAFCKPDDTDEDWTSTDLWSSASAIPGVKVLVDNEGMLAHEFGGATSGQVVVYDATRKMIFAGGITRARGHSGDNAGSDAIVALLGGQQPDQNRTPVYGCPLFDPKSDCNERTQECKQ